MTKLIEQINNYINIDKVRYIDNFEYKKSHYASMDFPEVGKSKTKTLAKRLKKSFNTYKVLQITEVRPI